MSLAQTIDEIESPQQTNMSISCSSTNFPTTQNTPSTKEAYVDWMNHDQAVWCDLHRFARHAGISVGIAAAKARLEGKQSGRGKGKYQYYHKAPDMSRIGYVSSRTKKGDSQCPLSQSMKVNLLGKKKTIAERSHELKLMVVIDPAIKTIRHNLKNAAFYMGERIWDRLFDQYDRDNSGCMDFDEFRALIRRDGRVSERNVTDEMLELIFGTIDVDKSGAIEISELVEWLEGPETTIWEDYHLNTYKPGLRPERKNLSSPQTPQSKRGTNKLTMAPDWKDDLISQMGKQIEELKAQMRHPDDQRVEENNKLQAQTTDVSHSVPSLYFCVSVSRLQGESLGLKLKPNLRVESVLWDGIVAAWNSTNPDTCVQPGDRILEVNGKRESTSIIEECTKLQHLDIFFERMPLSPNSKGDNEFPEDRRDVAKNVITFSVDVNRSLGEDLGLQLKWPAMQVEKISWQGLIGAWNMKHADHAVQMGDRVIEVNKVRGGGNIVPELKRLKRLHIVFARGEVEAESSATQDSKIITLESKKEDVMVGKIRRNLKAAAYTAHGLDWSKLFRWADHTKSGLITYDEFHHLIRVEAKLSAKVLPEDQLKALFRQVDEDDIGEVTYLEFLHWLGFDRAEEEPEREHLHPREVKQRRMSVSVAKQVMRDIRVILFKTGSDRWPIMFEHYDRSKTGQISFNDFHMLMRKDFKVPDKVANEKVLREIFSCLDLDNSGAIAYAEFESWLTGQPVLES